MVWSEMFASRLRRQNGEGISPQQRGAVVVTTSGEGYIEYQALSMRSFLHFWSIAQCRGLG
jgi:hypothetical protein